MIFVFVESVRLSLELFLFNAESGTQGTLACHSASRRAMALLMVESERSLGWQTPPGM